MTDRIKALVEQDPEGLFDSLLSPAEQEAVARYRLGQKSQPAETFSPHTSSPALYPSVLQNAIQEDVNDPRNDLDYKEFLDSLLDPLTGTVRDFRIDDSRLPVAKNFYDYCFNILGSDANPPWARQMIEAVRFLGEYCPKCSNPEYIDPSKVSKKFPSIDLKHPKRIVFLENGVCPVCGATKHQLIAEGYLPPYTQGVFVWGQRCLAHNTWVMSDEGFSKIGDLIQKKCNHAYTYGDFSPMVVPVYNGTEFETSSDGFRITQKDNLYRICLADGGVIECTEMHPLRTESKQWMRAIRIKELTDNRDFIKLTGVLGSHVYTDESTPKYKPSLDSALGIARQGTLYGVRMLLAQFVKGQNSYGVGFEEDAQLVRAVLMNAGIRCQIDDNPPNYDYDYRIFIDPEDYILLEKSGGPFKCDLKSVFPYRLYYSTVIKVTVNDTADWAFDFCMPKTHRFLANGMVNHNSGKSSTAATIASYTLHRYLKYPMLAELSKSMQRSTQLVGIFCSLTFQKAVDVLWTPFKNIVDTSNWFQEYFGLLTDYENKTGNKLLLNSAQKLAVGNKNLFCFPTGPKASTLRGNTSFMCFLDELGLFPLKSPDGDNEEDVNRRCSADEAYKSLVNSLLTVTSAIEDIRRMGYNSAPPAYMLSVSSPISNRDKVMRLLHDSERDNTIFPSHLPTWEINPTLERTSSIIASRFLNDPQGAMRDFGAQPVDSSQSFFSSDQVKPLFSGLGVTHRLSQKFDEKYLWGAITKLRACPYPTVMSLDAGYSNNSFAVSVMHYDQKRERAVVDCVAEVMPMQGKVVNFDRMYKTVILPLARELNVCYVAADQWNSIDLLHRLETDLGKLPNGESRIKTKKYSLTRSDFEAMRMAIANGSIEFPALTDKVKEEVSSNTIHDYKSQLMGKPVEHLLLQFETVVDMGVGLCPDKAPDLTDDLLRTVVLGLSRLYTSEVTKRIEKMSTFVTKDNRVAMPMPVVIGRSGMGGFWR